MPGLQGGSRAPERLEHLLWAMVADVAAQVLGHQREAEVPGELRMADGRGHLGVVGPGPAVEVVGTKPGPAVVGDAELRGHGNPAPPDALRGAERPPSGRRPSPPRPA